MLKPDKLKGKRPTRPIDAASIPLLKRAWKQWFAKHWRRFGAVLFMMSLLAATNGSYPIIIKYSYDMMAARDMSMLSLVIGAIIGTTALKGLFDYLQSVMANRLGIEISLSMQQEVFAHLMRADYARLTREPPAQIATHLTNDVNVINGAFMAILTNAIKDILTIIALIGSMFYIDWFLALIVMAIYPIGVLPILMIGRFIRRNSRRSQAQLGSMSSILMENLGGIRLVKTFRLEDYTAKRVQAEFMKARKLKLKSVEAKARLNPILETLGGIAVAGVIAIVAYRISGGETTVGDFTGFVTALLLAAQPFRALGNLNVKIQEGLAGCERLFTLLDEQPQIVDRPGAKPLIVTQAAIRFDAVSFEYRAGHPAVRDFTLAIPGGATVALVGRSGAGKSSIMNLVPRLYEPSAGTIAIDGQDINNVTIASLRGAMSIVSQDITLFNDTVRANIRLGKLDASEEEIFHAARAAAAHDFILGLPEGYETQLGDRGLRVSGGQRQRIALARAILRDAPILLLDEATSALDAESERLVQQALAEFGRNRTTLVIAHRLSTVQTADLICVMDRGTIVEMGTHAELLARDGHYADFCRSQLLVSADTLDAA